MAECLHCGGEFTPRKFGHVFCSVGCRHSGERRPEERALVDPDAVARLFDQARDPSERVRDDDWLPESHKSPEVRRLYAPLEACDTVETRRRWYLALAAAGRR
jgi:hypothetical protein